MELECTIPNLAQTPLNADLRAKVILRYRDLLKNLFPLWSTFYNNQLRLWLNAKYPHFVKSDLSASAVVNYLLQTYASSSGKFLFQEPRRAALILALKTHRPANYLLNYIASRMETLPHKEECQSRLFEEVASLVTKCLHTPECRHIVETAIIVNSLPENLKSQFNKQFFADLKARYAQAGEKRDAQISKLEFNFFTRNKASAAVYLNAVATPLAFLNSNNVLGEVSRVFKAKVKGGSFPIENLSLASIPHLWPELTINLPRLSSSTLINLRETACAAIQEEIQILLEHTLVPKEKKEKYRREALGSLETLCRTQDLKNIVLYYTGEEFVCFREDDVFKDIAHHNTQKYPPGFLDKMKNRWVTAKRSPGGGALPSPVLNSPYSPNIKDQILRIKAKEKGR